MAIVVVRNIDEMQKKAEGLRLQGKRIGVVPTMGSLHEGHLSLIRTALLHADYVITTLFVNPTQFGPKEDFSRYPRDFERDLSLASNAGCDILFAPETRDMYPVGYSAFVSVEGITDVLEGKSRPGHFRGVTTVVAKLFNITKPHVAVFGQKDAQQAAVIRQMTKDLNFAIQIIVAPIVREVDGLAMSSRNAYLTPQQRKEAVVLSRSLKLAEQRVAEGARECCEIIREMADLITKNSTGEIDYISVADNRTLKELDRADDGKEILVSMAVRFGSTRLIDNTVIRV